MVRRKPPNDLQTGIVIRGLSRRFPQIEAVREINLEVSTGEIFGLVGPDGAGKTTTLRMVAGLTRPSAGEVWIQRKRIDRRTDAVDQIGYMPQRVGLYPDLTVAENLAFIGSLRGLSTSMTRERGASLLEMTRLTPFLERPAGKLSGGMKQKLALCCSLLHEPSVLILDEPTNGVDPVSRRDFWKLLRKFSRRGLTILMATAYMDEAERCSRVGLLSEGRMIAQAAPLDLINHYADRCFEIRTGDQKAIASLSETTLVPSTRRNLLFVTRSRSRAWLESRLAQAGLAVELAPAQPTLEDLFVLMTTNEEQRVSA